MNRARKVLMWFLIAFAIYAIFKSPDQAADIVRSAFNGLADIIGGIGEFFDALLAG
ncbi:hypothetical protein [Thalassiella azotivora]